MRVDKTSLGYIKSEKRWQALWLAFYVILGVAIFLVGFYLNHKSKTNVFTVIAILMVLPAAKRVVALTVLFPYHSVKEEEYREVKQLMSEEAELWTDYVFTSTEKIMGLRFLIIDKGNLFGVTANEKQYVDYINTYLGKGVHDLSPDFHVKIVTDQAQMLRLYAKRSEVEVSENQMKAVKDYLRSLAV